MVDQMRFHFLDRIRLWFDDNKQGQFTTERFQNTITLSEAFYREIDRHRIPVEREVVAALAHAPGALDFYVWLVWKSWSLQVSSAHISLLGPGSLNEQLGTTHYSLDRAFRLAVSRWLKTVKALWPECPATIVDSGQTLLVRSSRKCPAIQPKSPESL